MTVVGVSAEKIEGAILRLWERVLYFFWAVAAAGAAIFIILLAAWWFKLGNGADVFKAYGWLPLTVTTGAAIFGIWRWLDGRPATTVFLVPADDQSFWRQSPQNDGRVTTQFCFRMHVMNLTGNSVTLTRLKLIRPRFRSDCKELASRVITQHPTQNDYGEHAILPHAFSRVCCDLILDRPIGKPGKSMNAVVAVADEHGRFHNVKFEKLRSSMTERH